MAVVGRSLNLVELVAGSLNDLEPDNDDREPRVR